MTPTALAERALPRPAPGTIKGLAWKLVYGNHRAELGPDGWERIARATGAPADVKALDLDADLPLQAFNEGLVALAQTRPGASIEDMGHLAARRWGAMYRTLVAQLAGRPDLLLATFCREVYPWLVADPGALRVVEHHGSGARVEARDALHPAFRAGLLRGFVELAGVEARVEIAEDGTCRVSWTEPALRAPAPWQVWLAACRLRFLPWTLVPLAVGSALAWSAGAFEGPALALAVAALVALHLSANLFNDVVDHRRGVDPANLTPTPLAGGSRVIQRGLVSWGRMAAVAGALGVAGVALGLVLIAVFSPPVLLLGLAGVALGFSYTGPPLRLAYRGLGEVAVALAFGPLVVAGTYAVHAGAPSATSFAVGVPVGLFAAAMLLAGEIPDAPWDAKQGKRTLAVAAGTRAPGLVTATLAAAYASIALLVALEVLPVAALAALATFPLAAAASRHMIARAGDAIQFARAQWLLFATHVLTGLALALALALAREAA